MITIELQGGLGNQLFQIFTTIAYALENRSQFLLPYEKKDKFSAGDEANDQPIGTIYFINLRVSLLIII